MRSRAEAPQHAVGVNLGHTLRIGLLHLGDGEHVAMVDRLADQPQTLENFAKQMRNSRMGVAPADPGVHRIRFRRPPGSDASSDLIRPLRAFSRVGLNWHLRLPSDDSDRPT